MCVSPTTCSEVSIEAARACLQRGEFAAAEQAATAALAAGASSEALYLQATARRYLHRHTEALSTLEALQRIDAGHARLYQERGHNLLALQHEAPALSAYRDAVSRNPALLASWKAIARLTRTDPAWRELAREADIQVRALSQLPPEILSGQSMLHEGRLERAEALCRHFLRRNPQHTEGMRLLAAIAVQHGQLEEAAFLLESAAEFNPANLLVRLDHVNVLYRQQRFTEALAAAEALQEKLPGNPSIEATLANQLIAVGRFDEGIARLRGLLEKSPGQPSLLLTLGHALKTVGDAEQAIAAYRAAMQLRPDFGDAWWSLANLKTFRFADADRELMMACEAAPNTAQEDRIHLCFALGKACEDRADYDASWTYYERGNRLRHATLGYQPERMARRLRRQQAFFTRERLDACGGGGHPAPDPIFIVGMPRAGSTLLEQILSSHSAIDGTMELNHIPALAQRLDGHGTRAEGDGYPERLANLDGATLRDYGEQFLAATRIHRQGAPFFIDKMPNNFRHIGLIHLILPNARIIDARRDPMDCCFGNYRQLFASGQEFTYDLTDVGRYYRDYVALMDHWDRVLPGKVLRVQHEDVLDDLEGQIRRMLDFLGLEFEAACLRYYDTDRAVRTPSSEQVRQPLFRSAQARWRHYERWLEPLRAALEDEPDAGRRGRAGR